MPPPDEGPPRRTEHEATIAAAPGAAVPHAVELRRLGPSDCVAELTRLLHRSYAPLAAMGLRYLATHQPDEVTRERAGEGECHVALAGHVLVGTVLFRPADRTAGCPWYDRPGVASFGQFAVAPEWQSRGLGGRLMGLVEARAAETGAEEIALDTAEAAAHLIAWYARRGYRLVGHARWRQTNYRSVVMSKRVAEPGA